MLKAASHLTWLLLGSHWSITETMKTGVGVCSKIHQDLQPHCVCCHLVFKTNNHHERGQNKTNCNQNTTSWWFNWEETKKDQTEKVELLTSCFRLKGFTPVNLAVNHKNRPFLESRHYTVHQACTRIRLLYNKVLIYTTKDDVWLKFVKKKKKKCSWL